MATRNIKHDGRITSINENDITVTILAKSACTSCEAKGLCNSSEMKDKDIHIKYLGTFKWEVGEVVNVTMKPSMGPKAVFYGYVYPFLFLIAALIVVANITPNEIIIGLSALGGVAIYYTLLWMLRDQLNSTFVFELEKFIVTQSVCH
jgi:sigma-E factor negative regulatory protein RseC